ncbi:hypothetical protein UY3_13544 [Chelonia mydas]|uniref:Uncharacterized protein n=1 Tax=Chelonia mydas TaxID=8469 RepID=M7AV66_CHEMY|nr:hypothetical protein UY3_13544 [Chelonia mydas]
MAWYVIATLTSAVLPAELGPQSAAITLRSPSSEGSGAERLFGNRKGQKMIMLLYSSGSYCGLGDGPDNKTL